MPDHSSEFNPLLSSNTKWSGRAFWTSQAHGALPELHDQRAFFPWPLPALITSYIMKRRPVFAMCTHNETASVPLQEPGPLLDPKTRLQNLIWLNTPRSPLNSQEFPIRLWFGWICLTGYDQEETRERYAFSIQWPWLRCHTKFLECFLVHWRKMGSYESMLQVWIWWTFRFCKTVI